MHLDLHLHQLKPADHSQRRRYVEWMLERQAVAGNFSIKIFFSDEAHFINEQNFLIWDSQKPQVIEISRITSRQVTVWWALWSEVVIGPYFFENVNRKTVTVNS